MTAPGWTDTAVWYAVYPLGMTGALHPTDPSEGHRLIRVEGWLDHLVSLGCNGLLLGPIFTSRSHGYDTNPIGGFDQDKIAEAFDLDADRYVPVLIMSIGKAATEGHESVRLPAEDLVWWR